MGISLYFTSIFFFFSNTGAYFFDINLEQLYSTCFLSLFFCFHLVNFSLSPSSQMILKLDTSRNKLLITNTTLVVYLVSISFGAYLTGIFGMNLDQTVTMLPIFGLFETVFVTSFSLIIIVSSSILYYLKRKFILPSELEYHDTKEKHK